MAALEGKEQSRVLLAQQFFDLATGLHPAAIRASIGRLYYASFHLAVLLTDSTNHGEIARSLQQQFGDLGMRYRQMHQARCEMDYFAGRFDEMNAQDLQDWYERQTGNGVRLYRELHGLLAAREASRP